MPRPRLDAFWLPAVVLFSAATLIVLGLTPFGAALSPDAQRYIEVARNLRAGHGFVVTDWTGPDPGALKPFTTYAPLYPLALSLSLGLAGTAELAASRLAIGTLFATMLLCFALLRPALGRDAALVAALALSMTQPILTVYTFAWSESLTLPLLLLACSCSLAFVHASRENASARQALLLCGLTLALAAVAWCRYIGVLFAILLPLTWLWADERRRWVPDFLAAGLAYAGFVAALALRNWRLTGLLSGAEREPSAKGLGRNLLDLGQALLAQVSWRPGPILFSLALALAAVFLLRRAKAVADWTAWNGLARTVTVLLATYTVGLLFLRTQHKLDRIDTRFVAPAFVLLAILLALAAGAARGGRRRWVPLSAAAVFALSLCVCQGIATYSRASAGWDWGVPGRFPLSTDEWYFNYSVPEHERDAGAFAVSRAGWLMDGGQYDLARMQLEYAVSPCQDSYEIDKARARVSAGLGDVASCLAFTRDCLAASREAPRDLVADITRPFWAGGRRLHGKGIEFLEELRSDVGDAWWIDYDIGTLARLLRDTYLADKLQCRGMMTRAGKNLDEGRYSGAIADLHDAEPLCRDPYPLERGRATAFAGLGQAQQSLKYTRKCLALDRARTLEDLASISAPFWTDRERYEAGVAYYRGLESDLGELPWLRQQAERLSELGHRPGRGTVERR